MGEAADHAEGCPGQGGQRPRSRAQSTRRAVPPHLLKRYALLALNSDNLESLLGLEGNAARIYFTNFCGMLKAADDGDKNAPFTFEFTLRNRRPPTDPVKALLSFAYRRNRTGAEPAPVEVVESDDAGLRRRTSHAGVEGHIVRIRCAGAVRSVGALSPKGERAA